MDISELKNKYRGQEGYCISCGPSAGKLTPTQHAELADGRVTFTVKQAIRLLPQCDFHFFNMIHNESWDYGDKKPISISVHYEKDNPIPADIQLPLRHTHWVAKSQQWEEWILDKGDLRPWGPGIMVELGIYLFLYLGLRKVYISGWDMSAVLSDGTAPHFYGDGTHRILNGDVGAVIDGSAGMWKWLCSQGCELVLVSDESKLWSGIPRYLP